MVRKLLLVLVVAAALPAVAAEKTFTWTPPTQNTDGSPVTPLAGYTLTCGELEVQIAGGSTTTYKRDFGPGEHVCTMRARAVNGQISAPSNAVSFTVPQPTPSPPAGFSVD